MKRFKTINALLPGRGLKVFVFILGLGALQNVCSYHSNAVFIHVVTLTLLQHVRLFIFGM